MAANKTTNQYLEEIAAGSGGIAYNVNIDKVNGASPADLATETTLAAVNTTVGTLATETTLEDVSVGIGLPTDVKSDDPENVANLIAVNKGFWYWFTQIIPAWIGTAFAAPLGSPLNNGPITSIIRGFWQDFIARWKLGSGTQADALRVTLSTDGQFVTSTGNTTAAQTTTSIVSNTETTADSSVIGILKLIAAKLRGQTGQRSIACTTGGASVIMSLGGQTYKDFGIQVGVNTSSSLSPITITVSGSCTATTTGGNYELLKTITVPASTDQRIYDIMLNTPIRTLRFSATGGAVGATVTIIASCY